MIKPSRIPSFITTLWLSCMALLTTGQASAAIAYIDAYPAAPETPQYIESTTGSVSYSGSSFAARASAGNGTLRIRSSIPQQISDSDSSGGSAGFYNNIMVNPGSSGLNVGDRITLSISFSLDGLLGTTVINNNTFIYSSEGGSGNTNADLTENSYFYVLDKRPTTDEGGGLAWSSSVAVDFQPYASLRLNGSWRSWEPAGSEWEYVHNEGWGWSWTNNLGETQSAGVPVDPYNPHIYYCGTGSSLCENSQFLNFDTGQLTIDFQTAVGNMVGLNALMEIVAGGISSSDAVAVSASSNFMNTFSTNITDPYGTGIELVYELPPEVVPVPAAVWLFGSGLVGLIVVARRKR